MGLTEELQSTTGNTDAPLFDIESVIRRGRARRVRGRVMLSVASAVLVTGTGAGGYAMYNGIRAGGDTAVIGSPGGQVAAGPPVDPAPAPPAVAIAPFTYMFDSYSAGAYKVLAPEEVTTTYQTASITTEYQDPIGETVTGVVGSLTVYRPGVRPPAIFTSGTKVTVHGLPGFANERDQDARIVQNGKGVTPNPVSAEANTFAWQYAADSWAVINSVIEVPREASLRLTAADEQALADGFRLGTPSRARMPFQVGYLPTGWEVVSVDGRSFTDDGVGWVSVIFAPSSSVSANKIRHFADATDGPAVDITILPAQQTPVPDAPKTKNTCGPLYTDTDLGCSWSIPHTHYFFTVHDPAGTLSSTELINIGQGLTFDNLDKPDTWHLVP